ncbi:MAG: U32 family peptidase, partial [Brachymonas sp.]|nr:U32 family peptidase [Brachymonas sp.]
PFVAGPHLNIYNLPALEWIASLGACRWVAPLEMKHSDISQIQASRPQGVQTEIFAFGRMPLAFSARCFTARHRNLHKDNCGFSCVDYPDGLLLRTREQEEFLVLNGIQIQSARVCNLAADLPALQSMGANILRLSPQSQHMPEIITLWRTALDGQIPAAEAATRINTLLPAPACNGYWHGTAGMTQLTP